MAEYKWTIDKVDCYTLKDGLENVAYNVHWTYSLTEGEDIVSMNGVTGVGSPNPDNFLSFDQLTEDIVAGWVESIMDVDRMKNLLTDWLDEKKAPKVITLKLSQVVEPEA